MPRTLLVSFLCALSLGGCDFLMEMLPRKATSPQEARQVMQRCGMSPEQIEWEVTSDGTLVYGGKKPAAPPMRGPESRCLFEWVKENRIKFLLGLPNNPM